MLCVARRVPSTTNPIILRKKKCPNVIIAYNKNHPQHKTQKIK